MVKAESLLHDWSLWREAAAIQAEAVAWFYGQAAEMLAEACPLRPPASEQKTVNRNLFSIFFLTCAYPFGLTQTKKHFYARINHCLRALVTGCDNLLDDEYKEIFPFALAGSGTRFRSVLTLMTADRLISDLAAGELAGGNLSLREVRLLSRTVLAVLTPSGLEEHEEESLGEMVVPTPEEIFSQVHHRKTGLLFRAPLDLIAGLENGHNQASRRVADGLRDFGIGCQLLDDLKDVAVDLSRGRFNAVISLARYGDDHEEKEKVCLLEKEKSAISESQARDFAACLPRAHQLCRARAGEFFSRALDLLASQLPGFDQARCQALIELISGSIMAERNDDVSNESGLNL